MPCSSEKWKPIVGFEERYEVSDRGLIRHRRTRHVLAQHLAPNGYLSVKLYISSGRDKTYAVSNLVCAAFLGPKPSGWTINHINGVKRDNWLVNLEYMTFADNNQHARENGLQRRSMEGANKGKFIAVHKPLP